MFWRTLLPFDILFSGTGAQGDEAPASPQGVPLIPTFSHEGEKETRNGDAVYPAPSPRIGRGTG